MDYKNRSQISLLAKMWEAISKEPDAYFQYLTGDNDWVTASTHPNITSNLDEWRVYVPPKEWIPKKGSHVISSLLNVWANPSNMDNDLVSRGMTGSQTEVEERAEMLRFNARLHNYVCEKAGGLLETTYANNRYFLTRNTSDDSCYLDYHGYTYTPGIVYMNEPIGKKLIKDIESGVFKI